MIREFSAGIVPFTESSGRRKYLLILSNLTENELWEFPKGAIEQGELTEEAAVRELREETGIEELENVPGFRKEIRYFYRRQGHLIRKSVTYFLARIRNETVRLSAEGKDYVWAEPEEARARIRHRNMAIILNAAEKFLANRNKEP